MNTKVSPTIALLIPCFNGIQHLPKLMENASQLNRSFDEIIVYDDVSTEPFPFDPIDKFPEIKFHRGETNGGAGYARNRLMELASTDYIHFHDIDDPEIPDNFLTELAPYLAPNIVVFSSWQIQWLDGRKPSLYDYLDFDKVEDFRWYFLHHHVHMNAAIFPKKLALETKFDEDFRALQDLLFNIRLAQSGADFRHVDSIIAKHQKNSESTISRMKQQKFQEYRAQFCQRCLEILPEQYYPEIGDIALYHAWNSCLQDFIDESKLAITVARKCGKLNYSQFGKAVALIAPLLGLSKTFAIRKWWFKFNKYINNRSNHNQYLNG